MSVVFISVLTGANIYLSKKFGWIFSMENIRFLHLLFVIIPIYMIAGLIGFSNAVSRFGSVLYILAAGLTGVMLYLVLSMLLTDLISLLIKFEPRVFGIIVISLTVGISLYGIWNATNTRLSKIEIPIRSLKNEIRLMHLSDIHLGHFRGKVYLQKIVNIAKEQEPDLVVISGDLFDGRIRMKLENISPLKDFKVPVYFVEGNHDGYTGVRKIKDFLRKTGINVLENEIVHQDELQIIGLNHMKADNATPSVPPNPSDMSIRSVLSELNIDKNSPTLLIHHSPDGMKYAHEAGVDLYLSGHTHAGQLFPVNLVNDLLFRYNKGLHDYKGSKIYVSQGAGTFGPPMRVGTKSEVTLITLIP